MSHIVALTALAVTLAIPAQAGTIPFSGSIVRRNPPAGPVGRCAALTPPALTVINDNSGANVARGTSSLGDFSFTASECIRFPPGIAFDGVFDIAFDAGGSLFGMRSSVTSFIAPGVFGFVGTYIVIGGTGRYGGATGLLTENGRLDRTDPAIALATGDFTGSITVAEPGAAAMALFGLAGLGAIRRHRAR